MRRLVDAILRSPLTLNRSTAVIRTPIKLGVFMIVVLFVLYPRPSILMRHIHHLRHLDHMIEPNSPAIARLHSQFKAESQPGPSPFDTPRRVEAFVYKHLPYDWDWNVWGVADYMPTVEEALAAGREDCDGRAVVAASLLRRLGHDSALVSDLKHVWVVSGKNELMGPGHAKSVVSTPTGMRIDWTTLLNIPRSLAFGIAVFPVARELLILAAAVLLLAHPRMSRRGFLAGTLILFDGLLFCRAAHFVSPDFRVHAEQGWAGWVGLAHLSVGFLLLAGLARRARIQDRLVITQPEYL